MWLTEASAVATGNRQEVAGHCHPSPSRHLLHLLARSQGHLGSSFIGQCRAKGKGQILLPLLRLKVNRRGKGKSGSPTLSLTVDFLSGFIFWILTFVFPTLRVYPIYGKGLSCLLSGPKALAKKQRDRRAGLQLGW